LDFFSVPTLPSVGHSAKALPSARQKTLGKDTFADPFFTECPLPSAALDKAFVECKLGFAETESGSGGWVSACLYI